MKLSYPLLKLLNIHHEEQPLVLNLMAIQFFQGAGIAFFFTSTFAMFLQRLSVNDLPLTYLMAAFLLFVTSLLFSVLEHKMKITNLGLVISIIMALSVLVFRLFCGITQASWYLIFMLSWFYVLYLLNNLSFWGMASVMFDVRQSKRLFGLISSGDIPAKFVGYTLASLLVSFTGTANLLYIGAGFILASAPFMYNIARLKIPSEVIHHPAAHFRPKHINRFKSIIERFTANKLIEKTAILALLFSVSLILINFIFYAEIKTAYHEDEALAKFIALFLAGSRIFALLLKLVFTGRMMARLGFKRSLMITPVVLFSFALLILISQYLGSAEKMVFYLFGMMAIAADVLNSAIHLPGFLTLMQPLPTHERLRAHNIVKGVMDPFAYLACGLGLLFVIHFYKKVDLIMLCYILIALLVFWVLEIISVNRQYLKTLIQSISTRTFNKENISITDKESLQLITAKMQSGTSLEKIYLLKLLRKSVDISGMIKLLSIALSDPSIELRKEAINAVRQVGGDEAIEIFKSAIADEKDPEVLSSLIESLCKIKFDEEVLSAYLSHEDAGVQLTIISVILGNADSTLFSMAENRLKDLSNSGDVNDKLLAIEIIGRLRNSAYSGCLATLIQDDIPEVSHRAILASGKMADKDNIKMLLTLLHTKEESVLGALMHAGEPAIGLVIDFILTEKSVSAKQQALLRMCGRIGGKKTADQLLRVTQKLPEHLPYIVDSLKKCKFKAQGTQIDVIESLINKQFVGTHQIHSLIQFLETGKEKYDILYRALIIERDSSMEMLLDLFSFLYDTANIDKIRRGLRSGKKDNIAISIELIEVSLTSRHSTPFLHIFERQDHHAQNDPGYVLELSQIHWYQLCDRILSKKDITFNSWTKACCLYAIKQFPIFDNRQLVLPYLQSENVLLREIAEQLS